MLQVRLDNKENSIIVIRDAFGMVVAMYIQIHPGQTKEVSLALDSVNNTAELPEYMQKFGIRNEE